MTTTDDKLQHPNVKNTKLVRRGELEMDRVRYLAEIRIKLFAAVLDNDTVRCLVWIINLHKYILLYGVAFTTYI